MTVPCGTTATTAPGGSPASPSGPAAGAPRAASPNRLARTGQQTLALLPYAAFALVAGALLVLMGRSRALPTVAAAGPAEGLPAAPPRLNRRDGAHPGPDAGDVRPARPRPVQAAVRPEPDPLDELEQVLADPPFLAAASRRQPVTRPPGSPRRPSSAPRRPKDAIRRPARGELDRWRSVAAPYTL